MASEIAYDIASTILESGSSPIPAWNGHGAWVCTLGMREDPVDSRMVRMQYMMVEIGERITKPTSENGQPRVKNPRKSGQEVTNDFTCHGCRGREGYTNLGDGKNEWWVCAVCKRPTEKWLRALGDDVLNMFRGGPADGLVYESSFLLTAEGLRVPVYQYMCTQEMVTSKLNGRVARVWVFQPGPTPSSVAVAQTTTTTNGVNNMSVPEGQVPEVPEVPQVPEAPAAPEAPAEKAPKIKLEPVDTSDLVDRRKALGLSRTVVAAAAQVTVSQLYRIENGGARTKQEEADQVRAAIVQLEADAAAAAAVAAEASAANPT